MLSRFHLISERYGQTDRRTDGQTDRFAISISRISMLTRDKNHKAYVFDVIMPNNFQYTNWRRITAFCA